MPQPKYLNNNPYPIVGFIAGGNKKEIAAGEVVEGVEYSKLVNPKMLSPYHGPRGAGKMQRSVFVNQKKYRPLTKINQDSHVHENPVPRVEPIQETTGDTYAQRSSAEWIEFGENKNNLQGLSRGDLVGLGTHFGQTFGNSPREEIVEKMHQVLLSKNPNYEPVPASQIVAAPASVPAAPAVAEAVAEEPAPAPVKKRKKKKPAAE